jgi:hypothetical protein
VVLRLSQDSVAVEIDGKRDSFVYSQLLHISQDWMLESLAKGEKTGALGTHAPSLKRVP